MTLSVMDILNIDISTDGIELNELSHFGNKTLLHVPQCSPTGFNIDPVNNDDCLFFIYRF